MSRSEAWKITQNAQAQLPSFHWYKKNGKSVGFSPAILLHTVFFSPLFFSGLKKQIARCFLLHLPPVKRSKFILRFFFTIKMEKSPAALCSSHFTSPLPLLSQGNWRTLVYLPWLCEPFPTFHMSGQYATTYGHVLHSYLLVSDVSHIRWWSHRL